MKHRLLMWGMVLLLLALSGCSTQAVPPSVDVVGTGAASPAQSAPQAPSPPAGTAPPTGVEAESAPPDSTPVQTTASTQPPDPQSAPSGQQETSPPTQAASHPEPVDETVPIATETTLTCTLEIRCDTALAYEELDPSVRELLPEDGLMLRVENAVFYEGETVFNLLQREIKANKLHLEHVKTPVYSSAYIEGIGNLYEVDCGPLSGWMYQVNDWFPPYGCSRYALEPGDMVRWVYTCDLGTDVGGEGASIGGGDE